MTQAVWAINIAALTLCMEARGETSVGQDAVAHTLKNRLASGRWGHSLATVCLWPYQFSGWRGPVDPNFSYACNLNDSDPVLVHMRTVMQTALDATTDPTNNATHYHAISIPAPAWTVGATYCGQFGNQKFWKDVK